MNRASERLGREVSRPGVRLVIGFRLALSVGVAALMLLPGSARADAVDDAVRRVGGQLQCPVCEGESVADSPSGLAADMRLVIRTRLVAGEPDQQILDEFVGSYGDGILTEPPKRGISLGVWLGPLVGLGFGVLVVGALLSTWRRVPGRQRMASPGAILDPDVSEELRRFRQELGR